jgi:hypothetical protein
MERIEGLSLMEFLFGEEGLAGWAGSQVHEGVL